MTTRAARKATPARRPPAKPLDQRVERAPGSGERARAGGHDRRQDAEAEGPAHLLGGDDQAGPEALVGLVPPEVAVIVMDTSASTWRRPR